METSTKLYSLSFDNVKTYFGTVANIRDLFL